MPFPKRQTCIILSRYLPSKLHMKAYQLCCKSSCDCSMICSGNDEKKEKLKTSSKDCQVT
ncbi:CLUMA_CG008228, isoform A [Clunio marinus]|uniref:CLUMA_CG008228, isoform A n=1 Tax=Clunio marinus TaxID=568069 RepID=A0A1J1I349_9DIPT|nr:CLUMA_CG008228, isoform A [Clunio marinus]